SAELKTLLKQKDPGIKVVSPPSGGASETSMGATSPQGKGMEGLWGLLGSAFIGALLMLLTPCVFPMVPITVNFFLKQSEKEHHRPLAMASVYSGTIIVVLTAAVLLLGKVIINLANDAWFNLVLGGVLIFFAL